MRGYEVTALTVLVLNTRIIALTFVSTPRISLMLVKQSHNAAPGSMTLPGDAMTNLKLTDNTRNNKNTQ